MVVEIRRRGRYYLASPPQARSPSSFSLAKKNERGESLLSPRVMMQEREVENYRFKQCRTRPRPVSPLPSSMAVALVSGTI